MNYDAMIDRLGEGARPFCLVFLSVCLGGSVFLPWVNGTAQAAVAATIAGFVGMKGYENVITTKSGVETTRTTATTLAAPALTKTETTETASPPAKGKK